MTVAGLPIHVTDRGTVGVGATWPLAALQALEPCLDFGIGIGELAAVAGMPEIGSQPRQQYREPDRQRRLATPGGSELRMFQVLIFLAIVSA